MHWQHFHVHVQLIVGKAAHEQISLSCLLASPPRLSQAGCPGEGLRCRGCQNLLRLCQVPALSLCRAQKTSFGAAADTTGARSRESPARHRRWLHYGVHSSSSHVNVQEEERLGAAVLRHRCWWTQEDLQGQAAAPWGGGLHNHQCWLSKPSCDCQAYDFHEFVSPALNEPDFDARPMILLVGQYSTGKTTFIRYLLEKDFPGIRCNLTLLSGLVLDPGVFIVLEVPGMQTTFSQVCQVEQTTTKHNQRYWDKNTKLLVQTVWLY